MNWTYDSECMRDVYPTLSVQTERDISRCREVHTRATICNDAIFKFQKVTSICAKFRFETSGPLFFLLTSHFSISCQINERRF